MTKILCTLLFFALRCEKPLPPLAFDTFVGPTQQASAMTINPNCTVTLDATGNWIASAGCTAADIFVNAALEDFHLAPGSPAIGRAECLPEVVEDFDGKPRPTPGGAGTGCDIGAFQFIGASPPPAAPTSPRILKVEP